MGEHDSQSTRQLALTGVAGFVFLLLSMLVYYYPKLLSFVDRLVGLVVKASASRAEGPGFESRLSRDFFGVESYQ